MSAAKSSSMNAGKLIVIDGVNGSGKGSIINAMLEYYQSVRIPAVVYKLPDRDGYGGEMIDAYLKNKITIDSKYDILNMFAANRYAMIPKILSDIKSGYIVICDRYVFSAIAYHIPLHITDKQVIGLYCDIIGYFDKHMPVPDMVYLIDGDHLAKRQEPSELFHYRGDVLRTMFRMLHNVIAYHTSNYTIIKNKTDRLQEAANFIINDITTRL